MGKHPAGAGELIALLHLALLLAAKAAGQGTQTERANPEANPAATEAALQAVGVAAAGSSPAPAAQPPAPGAPAPELGMPALRSNNSPPDSAAVITAAHERLMSGATGTAAGLQAAPLITRRGFLLAGILDPGRPPLLAPQPDFHQNMESPNEFELKRERNIAQNQAKLIELGIPCLKPSLTALSHPCRPNLASAGSRVILYHRGTSFRGQQRRWATSSGGPHLHQLTARPRQQARQEA